VWAIRSVCPRSGWLPRLRRCMSSRRGGDTARGGPRRCPRRALAGAGAPAVSRCRRPHGCAHCGVKIAHCAHYCRGLVGRAVGRDGSARLLLATQNRQLILLTTGVCTPRFAGDVAGASGTGGRSGAQFRSVAGHILQYAGAVVVRAQGHDVRLGRAGYGCWRLLHQRGRGATRPGHRLIGLTGAARTCCGDPHHCNCYW